MPLTVCYPNQNSVKGITRVGWQEIGLLRTHLLPLDTEFYAKRSGLPRFAVSIGRRALKLRLPAIGYVVSESREPDAEVDGLWTALFSLVCATASFAISGGFNGATRTDPGRACTDTSRCADEVSCVALR